MAAKESLHFVSSSPRCPMPQESHHAPFSATIPAWHDLHFTSFPAKKPWPHVSGTWCYLGILYEPSSLTA